MNVADLDALVKSLQDPDLRAAMAHPDWKAVFDALMSIQDDREDGLYDLDDDTRFVHLLNKVSFHVAHGLIWTEDMTIATDLVAWHGGEWKDEHTLREEGIIKDDE